ncbi:CB1 cannabinoid receptor-interacting protein 1 [Parasteatoda tepidariorum]|uniref:CB1 cannabinoid receptor-interacting protein 1 n=1 Tax=Parasteatoda tepidariorum TaxID=114398 RepID=UPI00077FBC98|nr:CB1 cannabinoid receptor-interacting protein 1 [Parasteatoda tepidariorum]
MKYNLTLGVKRDDDNSVVYYKQDGQRFLYNCTIKMNVETTYKFSVNFRPPIQVKSATIKNSILDVREEEFTPESSTYALLWTTNDVCVSKKNVRDHFSLNLTIQGLGSLEIPLQFKFYKSNDKSHSVWGNDLHHIEYECSYKDESGIFEIGKEVFR